MEREDVIAPKDLLEDASIGRRPAYEWVEGKLGTLKRKYGLVRFKSDLREFEVTETSKSERGGSFIGQEERGNEAVGFLAGFVDGELKMLSVFADLEGRFIRFLRVGYSEQFNEWRGTREDFDTSLDHLLG